MKQKGSLQFCHLNPDKWVELKKTHDTKRLFWLVIDCFWKQLLIKYSKYLYVFEGRKMFSVCLAIYLFCLKENNPSLNLIDSKFVQNDGKGKLSKAAEVLSHGEWWMRAEAIQGHQMMFINNKLSFFLWPYAERQRFCVGLRKHMEQICLYSWKVDIFLVISRDVSNIFIQRSPPFFPSMSILLLVNSTNE